MDDELIFNNGFKMINLEFLKNKPDVIKLDQNLNSVNLGNLSYLELYNALRSNFKNSYIFESSEQLRTKESSRYYTIGFDPLYIISARDKTLSITDKEGKTISKQTDNPYNELRLILPNIPLANSYQGGLIGYFSYESAKYFDEAFNFINKEHEDFPAFELGLYTDGLIYDSETDELTYYTFHENRSALILDIISNIQDFKIANSVRVTKDHGFSIDKNRYFEIFYKTKEEIKKGNSFQVEVGFKKKYEIKGDKFAIYNRLRDISPSPYMYHMQFGEREMFGASPELVISLNNGSILSTPCAGTTNRGLNEDGTVNDKEDKELARKLLNDKKEQAEHAMLVDLHRNDISKVSKYGSVKVKDYMYLVKLKYVQHISSHILGEIREDKDSFDLLSSVVPCGVLTGAPKIETMKIISENEHVPRGPYGGAVGRFSFNGDCAFAMPIRSLFCAGDRCYNQACGGVVFDSDPEKEYQEVIAKLKGVEETIKDIS